MPNMRAGASPTTSPIHRNNTGKETMDKIEKNSEELPEYKRAEQELIDLTEEALLFAVNE